MQVHQWRFFVSSSQFKILFLYVYSYFKVYLSPMQSQIKPSDGIAQCSPRKRRKMSQSSSQEIQKNQSSEEMHSEDDSDSSSESQEWSSEVIEPAIKSMTFRARRGTRMKELMKGKTKNDHFWNKYQGYFGGGLDGPEDEEDQEDYEASSSGRDQFDSDFDLTDSYVGKRGRKKGSKVKKRAKPITKKEQPKVEKGQRGRKKKQVPEQSSQDKKELHQLYKIQQISTSQMAAKIQCPGEQNRKRKMEISSQQEDIQISQPKPNPIIIQKPTMQNNLVSISQGLLPFQTNLPQ